MQFRHDDYPPTDDEEDPAITDTKLSRALIELWQTNTEALHQENAKEYLDQQTHEVEPSLLDETAFLNILVIKEENRRIYVSPPTWAKNTKDGCYNS